MNPLSDDELTALLADLESDRVERKKAWAGDAPDKVRQAVCAFANDLPGHGQPGVVFIGANDDGSPANIEVTDQICSRSPTSRPMARRCHHRPSRFKSALSKGLTWPS